MDLAGILISASCVLTTSALLVTVYGGSGMPRFSGNLSLSLNHIINSQLKLPL